MPVTDLSAGHEGATNVKSAKINVLVVGQIPPPWHGQATAIKQLLDSQFESVDLHFVRMDFSETIEEVGRWRPVKVLRLLSLIYRIWKIRLVASCRTLYYPPGGTGYAAIIRDSIVLLSCRLLFDRVVFHVHAGGFTRVVDASPLPLRLIARRAYGAPDLLIQLTENSPPDCEAMRAKAVLTIPNGIPDNSCQHSGRGRDPQADERVQLLFVGAVSRAKGVSVLLEACAILDSQGLEFHLRVVGDFDSSRYMADCASFVTANGLDSRVEFVGALVGDSKWDTFAAADIFCFPSFYQAENQPLVVLEAMSFGLPIVATDWRGISTMVADGGSGRLVPVNDPAAMAVGISSLVTDRELRLKLGAEGRRKYLERYTDAIWRVAMESALCGP